ncbi:MAG: HD domain-containing protein [Desulfosarcinaceae bacterium]|nr:HD domain-containing protein [Desulfosarcinaceae bacterium]
MQRHPAPAASLTPEQAMGLKRWFLRHAAQMVRQHPRHRRAMMLKLAHSVRVSRNCADIGTELGLDRERRRLARTIGLLHDVARFEQVVRYDSFVDSVSVNHGALGADRLQEVPLVQALAATDRAVLLHAVRHHNAAAAPQDSDPGAAFYLKLVRDADKLDIFRVICMLHRTNNGGEPATEALQLSDAPQVTPAIAAAIRAQRPAPMAAVQTRVDLLLLRLSWVFDLSFAASHQHLARRGHLTQLVGCLPKTQKIEDLVNGLHSYVAKRLIP